MKIPYTLLLLLFFTLKINAETKPDTLINIRIGSTGQIKKDPQYPGGQAELDRYIRKTLKLSPIAKFLGLSGRIILTFVVEKDGSLTAIRPFSRRGIDCETEELTIPVFYNSKKWQPAIAMDDNPIRVQFTIPLFYRQKLKTITFKELKESNRDFVFWIDDKIYTVDEAASILGNSFASNRIEFAEPYNSYPAVGQKEVYLIKVLHE